MARIWSKKATAAIRREIERVGLRVVCLACGVTSRHFPADGRLRDARCYRCGRYESTRSVGWVSRFPTLAEAKRNALLASSRQV